MVQFLKTDYMRRKRIDGILDQAARCKLIYVVAGAGYGKTRAVRDYIEQQRGAVVRWVQLTESDNIGSNYWEHLTRNIALDNPGLALKLREFGFPETSARFNQFAEILKSTEHPSKKTFLVLDDFHLINSRQALSFAERCAHLSVPGACVIIISRKEPEINAVSLFAKGQACIVTEDELRFTENEIAAFLKFRSIPFSPQNISGIYDATKGWVLALALLTRALARTPENPGLAVSTMKENVYKLMETEAFNDFPEKVQKTLVQLALVSDLPMAPLHLISDAVVFIKNNPQLFSFIWFDSLIGDYRIHPLYSEFLREKQDILSPDEKLSTYRKAARWCHENDFYMDAMRYYAKSRQYEHMLDTLLSYPFKMPKDTCEYFFNILEELSPGGDEAADHSFLLLKNFFIPIMLSGMGRYEDAEKRSLSVVREWENTDTPFSLNLLYMSYSNLAYINMYTCIATHQYKTAEYMKKSAEYYKLSTVPPVPVKGAFAVADVRAFVCLVGEGAGLSGFDEFLSAAKERAVYAAESFHDMYYGYEDLVACEIAFYKNEQYEAKKYAHQATAKAKMKKQYGVEAMALQYLLRIAISEGNYSLAKQVQKQLYKHLDNPNFWSRQLLLDLSLGYFFAQTGLPALSPMWFVSDEREASSEIHSPVGELIVCVKNYMALKKYDQALTVLNNSYPREPHNRFLIGELIISLLSAVAKVRTGDHDGGLSDFKKAYALSFDGVFEMPFIELGKELSLLSAAALGRDSGIPDEWLRRITRKAGIYAKKAAVVRDSYKKDKKIKDTIQLTGRELEVLSDLYHGLTREEIAENMHISLPTVKKTLESIYVKLDASNAADAIRIAMKNNLIVE